MNFQITWLSGQKPLVTLGVGAIAPTAVACESVASINDPTRGGRRRNRRPPDRKAGDLRSACPTASRRPMVPQPGDLKTGVEQTAGTAIRAACVARRPLTP
jgi:hypothetical protein